MIFLHKIGIWRHHQQTYTSLGRLPSYNYLKKCKLIKLQRHKGSSAGLPGPLRHRRFPGFSRPFPLPSRPGAASAPLPAALSSRLALQQKYNCYSFNIGRIPRGQCRDFLGVSRWVAVGEEECSPSLTSPPRRC